MIEQETIKINFLFNYFFILSMKIRNKKKTILLPT